MQHICRGDFQLHNSAVALGKFEGLHRGHQLLFDQILSLKEQGYRSVVFTFDLPPRNALAHDLSFQQIYTKKEKRHLLEQKGIDILIEHPFTMEFAALSPERFIKDVLVKKVDARVIVVGSDFHFGRKRSGSVEDLKRYADECGYQLIIIPKLQMNAHDVSSTDIRDFLRQGQIEAANALLGRPFSIRGEVIHGKALGRTIQIPTVNQLIEEHKLVPPNGVYVSKIYVDDEVYYGISNIGVKPTVESDAAKLIETHIFDFDQDIYGKTILVELLHYKRPEMKFASIDALAAQMKADMEYGKAYVADHF